MQLRPLLGAIAPLLKQLGIMNKTQIIYQQNRTYLSTKRNAALTNAPTG
jgi:hypothetical protein